MCWRLALNKPDKNPEDMTPWELSRFFEYLFHGGEFEKPRKKNPRFDFDHYILMEKTIEKAESLSFNIDFLLSVNRYVRRYGHMSKKQFDSVYGLAKKIKVDLWECKK